MKCAMCTLAAGLILPAAAVAQDLPPEVLLLSRVRRHIQEELRRLPNISCLETVQREHKPARGKVQPLDTVRLEVLNNGRKELFASPGDRKFSEHHPISYAGSGVLGNGFFGLYLQNIVVDGYGSDQYKGEETTGGRRLARWDYRLSVIWAQQRINLPEGSGNVGLHGSFWADPETYDVIRLELNADDFPPALPLTEAVTRINFSRTDVGNNVVLLPDSGEFRMVRLTGEMSRNRIEFTHCRQYGADSTINFDEPEFSEQAARFGTVSMDDTLRTLPAGLQIAVKLRSRISGDLPVGALIDGLVATDVSAKGAVMIAAGSPVRGRIRRLEHYTEPFPYLVVALEFTEVELQGIRHRFYANLVDTDSLPGLNKTLSILNTTERIGLEVNRTSEELWLPNLPGVAAFFLKGRMLDLPRGFRTVWKTRPLTP